MLFGNVEQYKNNNREKNEQILCLARRVGRRILSFNDAPQVRHHANASIARIFTGCIESGLTQQITQGCRRKTFPMGRFSP